MLAVGLAVFAAASLAAGAAAAPGVLIAARAVQGLGAAAIAPAALALAVDLFPDGPPTSAAWSASTPRQHCSPRGSNRSASPTRAAPCPAVRTGPAPPPPPGRPWSCTTASTARPRRCTSSERWRVRSAATPSSSSKARGSRDRWTATGWSSGRTGRTSWAPSSTSR
ncbi:hypothetical protein [Streptomyces filipinensis]|uniref:hypothetical protein n=1 Tax=Streptomyces filipinensis TaxID=66887 RepID=UPI0027E429F8|nr:hypothetical protein [Streptomyces filipinensis]